MPNRAQQPVEPESPTGVLQIILSGVSPSIRPTLFSLITLGAMVFGAFWLDARAKSYIEGAAEARIAPVASRVEAHDKQLDEQDARMRTVEQSLAAMAADVRTVKEDTHSLRERADRRR